VAVEEKASFAKRVLPTAIGEGIFSSGEGMWQAGLADGRIRKMNQAMHGASLDALSQRVKQQLDPDNLFRGYDHEHAA
jgi:FAD/FMN-containing dehydrogenase